MRTSRAGSERRGAVRGFTLVELLVVVALVALVLAVAAPPLGRGGSRTEGLQAVRTVVSALRLTRDAALGAGDGARLLLDVDARSLEIPGAGRRSLPASLRIGLVTARSELGEDGSGAVRFFPDGSSTGARIRLTNRAGAWLVDVDWLTGAIASRELSDAEARAQDEVRVSWDEVASR